MMEIKGGYTGKILEVNLTNGKIQKNEIDKQLVKDYIGGRGFAAKLLYDRTSPEVDPLSPSNPLIFVTGPLSGIAPCSGRITVGARSPLTKSHGDSNVGGEFAIELKMAGYDAIVITGKAERPVYIQIVDDEVKINDAGSLWGKNTLETTRALLKEFGDKKACVACIGPAGENLVHVSGICVDLNRFAAEGGMGAVMGSKNLKAILVRGKKGVKLADIDSWKKIFGETLDLYRSEPTTTIGREIGSNCLLETHNEAGAMVWKNCQYGSDELGEITGGNLNEKYVTKARSGCSLCCIGCARHTRIESGPYEGVEFNGPEYYTTNSLGPRVGVDDLENVLYNSELCERLGLDSTSAPSIIGFAMECYQRGIITKEDVDNYELDWGNKEAITEILKKMAYRQGIGDVFADGIKAAVKKFGPESERYAMHVKGLDIPPKDPRTGLTYNMRYAISTRGADHLRCSGVSAKSGQFAENIDDMPPEKSMKLFVRLEKYVTEVNLLNVCLWAWSGYSSGIEVIEKKEKYLLELFNAATGLDFTQEDMDKAVERTILTERAENASYGLRRRDDYFPKRFTEEPLPTKSGGFHPPIVIADFEEKLDYYYKYRGLDVDTGMPLESKLRELGMDKVAEDLEKVRGD